MANPSVRLSASAASASSSTCAVTITGTPANGELILAICQDNENPTFAAPAISGFSTIASITTADWNPLYILGKIASSEGTNPTYTATWSGGAGPLSPCMGILVIADAKNALPTNTASTHDTSASTTFSIPALTTAVANSLDLVAVTHDGNVGTSANNYSAWGTSLVEVLEFRDAVNSGYPSFGIAAVTRASAGVQSATTVTSVANDKNVALRIEIEPVAAGGTTVTPGTLALTLTQFAPQANMKINAASPAALVTSSFAPVLKLAINGASPTALLTTSFAPVLGMKINGASPTALLLSAFAPTVTASGNQTVTPTTLALALAAFAPQLRETLTPSLIALTLATFAPLMKETITPGVVTLALSTFAPKLLEQLTPGTAALVVTGFAPRLAEVVTPGAAALVTAKFAPALKEVVTPGAIALVTQGYAPTVGNSVLITPGVLALTLASFAPTISGADVAQVIGLMSLVDEATARAILNDSRVSTATLRDELTALAEVRD